MNYTNGFWSTIYVCFGGSLTSGDHGFVIGVDGFSSCGDGLLNVMNCDDPFPIWSVRSLLPYTQISQIIKTKDLKTARIVWEKWTLFLDFVQKELINHGDERGVEGQRAEAILLEPDPLGCRDGTCRTGCISPSKPFHSVYRRRSYHFSSMWEHGEVGDIPESHLALSARLCTTLLWICPASSRYSSLLRVIVGR